MAMHVQLPVRLTTELRDGATRTAAAIRATHSRYLADLATLDANESGLPDPVLRKRKDEVRNRALGTMREAGDVAALDEALKIADGELDADNLISAARFLPPIVDATSEAADTRRIAEAHEYERYARSLRRMKDIGPELARVAAEAGDSAHASPSIARLAAISDHVETMQTGRAQAAAALATTREAIMAKWTMRNEALAAIKQARHAIDESRTRADAVRGDASAAKRLAWFDFEARRQAA